MPTITTIYVDLDGTLVGPGGNLLWDGSTKVTEALLAARQAGITVVPVTGRGRLLVREVARTLGFERAIGELGAVHVQGISARYELGDYEGKASLPATEFKDVGAIAELINLGLEEHTPWNEAREVSLLFRGKVDFNAARRALDRLGLHWASLINNGTLSGDRGDVFHLAPKGTDKLDGVRADQAHHNLNSGTCAFVGDSRSDMDCVSAVAPGWCWLVANAHQEIKWPLRTKNPYGLGVAEVIYKALES